jgi:hypothetical protein
LQESLQDIEIHSEKDLWQAIFAGNGFKITKSMMPEIYDLCMEVKEKLEIKEEISFYIQNDPLTSAFVIPRKKENKSHILVLNSGLVEKMDINELKFVLGHEMGHLLSEAIHVDRFIRKVYNDKLPLTLGNLYRIWQKLTEMTSDRVGYYVVPDLKVATSVLFKLSSGLDLNKVNFDLNVYLKEVDEILEKYNHSEVMFEEEHPSIPIRIKALQIFSEAMQIESESDKTFHIFNEKIEELVRLIELKPEAEIDRARLLMLITGGFLMSVMDDEITKEEERRIFKILSNFVAYPEDTFKFFIGKIYEEEKMEGIFKVFQEVTEYILEIIPGEKKAILNYLISIMLSDRKIHQNEIQFLYEVGENILNFHRKEISMMLITSLNEGNLWTN